MLRGAESSDLYSEFYNVVLNVGAKRGYSFLIGWASSLERYECFPSFHGVIKDFRFMRGDDWDFAFIPNQQWLLFYFRKPCLRLEKYSHAAIRAHFPEAHETPSGEFTVKVASLEEALRVAAYIES